MARPTKLTPEVQEQVCRAIRAGNYIEIAVRSAGISPATHHRWMKAGREAKAGIQRDYYEAVTKAEADLEVELVVRWKKGMVEDPRQIPMFLERRFAKRWQRRQAHELSGQDGGPVRVVDAMLEDPQTRKALRDALRRAGSSRTDQPGGAGAGD